MPVSSLIDFPFKLSLFNFKVPQYLATLATTSNHILEVNRLKGYYKLMKAKPSRKITFRRIFKTAKKGKSHEYALASCNSCSGPLT